MFRKLGPITLGTQAAVLVLTLAGVAPAQAESGCKGLENAACERNSACTWVDSFTRKDGVKVSGHCRAKPTQSDGKKQSKDGKK